MSERYVNLFSLPEKLYSIGSPVIIAAGALLKDNETRKVLAQLKFESISNKTIKAITVSITPYDTVGNPLSEPFSHQYLDLAAERDNAFGSKVPIFLPDASTRSFSVCVDDVIFQDNTICQLGGNSWTPITTELTQLRTLHDPELIKQFRLTYGKNSQNFLLEENGLWHCTCGALNLADEPECHICKNKLEVLRDINLDSLRKDMEKRLEEEAQVAAERKAEVAAKANKTKKVAKIVVPIATVLIAGVLLITKVIIPSSNYNKAEALLAAGDYEGAIVAFQELGDYKDSAERIPYIETQQALEDEYQRAIQALEEGNYEDAYLQLREIPEYKDVKTYLDQFVLLPVEFTATDIIDMKTTFYISYDDNGVMTEAYQGTDKLRQATFDENGQVIRQEEDTSYWHTDENGVVSSQENDFWYTFSYNADGSVISTKMPDDVMAAQFDEYGNITKAYVDGKEFSREDTLVDSHNNRYSGTKNTYSDEGHLISVKNLLRSDADTVEFLYTLFYDPTGTIDEDLVWKNIRILFGENIW